MKLQSQFYLNLYYMLYKIKTTTTTTKKQKKKQKKKKHFSYEQTNYQHIADSFIAIKRWPPSQIY